MSNINTEYYEGIGCQCMARYQGDCACDDVDWTPKEVYELRKKVAELEESLRTIAQTRCVSYEDLAIRDLEQQAKGAEDVIESVLGEPESLTSDALSIRYEFLDRAKQLREQAKGGDV